MIIIQICAVLVMWASPPPAIAAAAPPISSPTSVAVSKLPFSHLELGSEDDPIRSKLDQSIEVYRRSMREGADALLRSIEEQIEAIPKRKKLRVDAKLALREQLRDERESFLLGGETPPHKSVRKPSERYSRVSAVARKKCRAAFDLAAEEYGKIDLDAVRLVREEKTRVLNETPADLQASASHDEQGSKPDRASDQTPISDEVVEEISRIRGRMDRSIAGYRITMKEATTALVGSMDEILESIPANKKLDADAKLALREQLRVEREAFVLQGELPENRTLKKARERYTKAVKKARGTCTAEFDRAAEAYGNFDLDLAGAVRDEQSDLLSELPAALASTGGEEGNGAFSAKTTLAGHSGKVSAVRFAKTKSGQVVTGSNSATRILRGGVYDNQTGDDNTVRYWSAKSGAEGMTIEGGKGSLGPNGVQSLSFSHDFKLLAVATCRPNANWCDATVTVWKSGSDKRQHSFSLAGRSGVLAPWFGAKGKTLYAIRGDSVVHMLDLKSGSIADEIRLDDEVEEGELLSAAMDAGRTHIYAGMANGEIRQWALRDKSEGRRFVGHDKAVLAVHLSSDGTLLASASADGTARVFEVSSGQQVAWCDLGTTVTAIHFVPDRRQVLTGDEDGEVILWDIVGKQLERAATYSGHDDSILCLDIDSKGQNIVSGSADTTARVWRLPRRAR